jgi:hypothetical protein
MSGTSGYDMPTTELSGERGFPEPVAVISLRNATTYRQQDEDGEPILIITDGVTTIALDSGLSGLSFGVVSASHRLADAVHDFAQSITVRWQKKESAGRHRRNRRLIPVRRRRDNISSR